MQFRQQPRAAMHIAGAVLSLGALAACGGGGGAGGGSGFVPTAVNAQQNLATPAPPGVAPAAGPVSYLVQSDPTAVRGTLAAGTQSAIVAVMSAAGDPRAGTNPNFALDTFAVGSGASTQSSRRMLAFGRTATPPRELTPVEVAPADDARVRRLLQSLPRAGNLLAAPARRMQSVVSGAGVGTAANIWVARFALAGGNSSYEQVPATMLAQTPHANIWIDRSLLSGPNASDAFAAGALQSTVAQIGSDFENAYISDTTHFGTAQYPSSAPGLRTQVSRCDSSGNAIGATAQYVASPADGRVNVMVLDSAALGNGVGGYFSAVNYVAQDAWNCLKSDAPKSNEAPFIYVGWFNRNSSSYELKEDLVRGTAHELQHLISFVNHSVLSAAGGDEDPFVNEGLSMLAQDFAADRMFGTHFDVADAMQRGQAYLANPQNYSVSGFVGIDDPQWSGDGSTPRYNCAGGCYGAAYLFQRYLYDRFGGDAYAHKMEQSAMVGSQELQVATGSGESFGAILDDFAMALAANTMHLTPSDPRFRFGSLDLTGSYKDQLGGVTQLSGVYATPLSANQSGDLQAPIGGFAFATLSGNIAGAPITIRDKQNAAGFALTGGLAQH